MWYIIGVLLTFIFGIIPFIEIAKQYNKKAFSTLAFDEIEYFWHILLWLLASLIWPISLLISITMYVLLKKDHLI